MKVSDALNPSSVMLELTLNTVSYQVWVGEAVGASVGVDVGAAVGGSVGMLVGESVGA